MSSKRHLFSGCFAYCAVLPVTCVRFASAAFPWRQPFQVTDSGKYSTVKLCMCVLEPGTSSTCSASSNYGFFPPPSSCTSYPQPFFLRLTVAFLPASSSRRWAACTPLFPPQRRPNRRWVFSTWPKQTHLCYEWGVVWLALCESYASS